MRVLGGFCIALLLATGLFAQYRGNPTPVITGGFGNVVYPGGTPATLPSLTRTYNTVVNPGGGGPHLRVPYSPGAPRSASRSANALLPYAFPVYVYTGLYDGSNPYYGQADSAPQQPNVIVVYPPQPAPVIVNQPGPAPAQAAAPPDETYQQAAPPEDSTPAPETAHYLVAFKDHTIYSAVAYWVDGDTLHYFTTPNTHNQVSLSLVDRELTQRLNRESGMDMRLPPAK